MRVINLASGSKGNVTFFEASNIKLLLDAGLTLREIEKRLELINEKAENIDAIIITHEHVDHIKGFIPFLKKYNARGYIHKSLESRVLKDLPQAIIDKISLIETYDFSIGEVKIMPFELPHDSISCLGYCFMYKDRKVAFATDLGFMPKLALDAIIGSDLVYIESNHDLKMLRNCKYPYIVKQRIMSDHGHLSNNQAAEIVLRLARHGTKYFVLSHMSENSNTLEHAYLASARLLEDSGFVLEKDVFLRYSRQDMPGNNFNFGEDKNDW